MKIGNRVKVLIEIEPLWDPYSNPEAGIISIGSIGKAIEVNERKKAYRVEFTEYDTYWIDESVLELVSDD